MVVIEDRRIDYINKPRSAYGWLTRRGLAQQSTGHTCIASGSATGTPDFMEEGSTDLPQE